MILNTMSGKDKYFGSKINLKKEEEIVGCDCIKTIDLCDKLLVTKDIKTCIVLVAIGDKVSMAHLNIQDKLTEEQLGMIEEIKNISNLKTINGFIGPETKKQQIDLLKSVIDFNDYYSYIYNYLWSIENSSGNISYLPSADLYFGNDNENYIEYQLGYINMYKNTQIYEDLNKNFKI